jgi:hypothetical protein
MMKDLKEGKLYKPLRLDNKELDVFPFSSLSF